MRRPTRRSFVPFAAASATVLAVAACGTTSASTTASSSAQPITVGISLPLTGSFAADGQATDNGYKLWASDVNKDGGLLGRPVRLKILNDNSNEKLVTSQYTQLITQDHVDLTLAPFSTLLTSDALKPTSKYHYALPAWPPAAWCSGPAAAPHIRTCSVSACRPRTRWSRSPSG